MCIDTGGWISNLIQFGLFLVGAGTLCYLIAGFELANTKLKAVLDENTSLKKARTIEMAKIYFTAWAKKDHFGKKPHPISFQGYSILRDSDLIKEKEYIPILLGFLVEENEELANDNTIVKLVDILVARIKEAEDTYQMFHMAPKPKS